MSKPQPIATFLRDLVEQMTVDGDPLLPKFSPISNVNLVGLNITADGDISGNDTTSIRQGFAELKAAGFYFARDLRFTIYTDALGMELLPSTIFSYEDQDRASNTWAVRQNFLAPHDGVPELVDLLFLTNLKKENFVLSSESKHENSFFRAAKKVGRPWELQRAIDGVQTKVIISRNAGVLIDQIVGAYHPVTIGKNDYIPTSYDATRDLEFAFHHKFLEPMIGSGQLSLEGTDLAKMVRGGFIEFDNKHQPRND